MDDWKGRDLIRKLFRMDFFALTLQCLLLLIGVLFIYGVGIEIGDDFAGKWAKQILWICLGFAVYFFLALTDYRLLARWSWLFYVLALMLLISVFPFGKTINNARSWLVLPGRIMFQPSELMKPATLLLMAWAVSRPAMRGALIPMGLPVFLIGLVPVLIILLQPDHGTALVFILMTVMVIFTSGIRWRWVLVCLAAGILAVPLIFTSLKNYQKDRVKVFMETPANSILLVAAPFLSEEQQLEYRNRLRKFLETGQGRKRDNWNAHQSLLAVGSGGMTGRGYLKGTQHVLGYLPKTVAPTDFIFSVIAEETGFAGSFLLLGMLACLCLCYCRTALISRNMMGCFIAAGAAGITATHTLINIGMTIQAAPIIGIPLPFVSYGGSFMLGTMILAGLVQNVHVHRRILENEAHDED